jgi:hypothetical protein
MSIQLKRPDNSEGEGKKSFYKHEMGGDRMMAQVRGLSEESTM